MKASIAFVAAASASIASAAQVASGSAKVINYCDSDFPFQNVPATTASGAQQVDGTLKANGGTFSANYEALPTGGWSIKINAIKDWSNIFQFEYTYDTVTDVIWTDMSFVNGIESMLPEWKFECPTTVMTKGAYQHATDDANGMQKPVAPASDLTLVLCPSNASSGDDSSSSASASASAVETSAAATVETTAAAPSTTLQTYASTSSAAPVATTPAARAHKQVQVDTSSAVATTAAAPVVLINDDGVAVVTAYETKVVTAVVTETAVAAGKHRRHEHRHPHGHSF